MTLKEVVRLKEWMTANQIPLTKIMECIEYIAGTPKPQKEAKEKKSTVKPHK